MLRRVRSEKDYEDSVNSSNSMELAYQCIMRELIEDVVSDNCFQVHRGVKFGYFPIHEYVLKDHEFEIYNPSKENTSYVYRSEEADIFGHFKGSKAFLCCPHCKKRMGSSRFATHLSSCMGFGRSKRSSIKRQTFDLYESDHDEDGSSSDCNSSTRKRKKGKNSRRKVKGKNCDPFMSSSSEANYAEIPLEDIGDRQMCGVISERTGRSCRNTVNCSVHFEDQKREVRHLLLGSTIDQMGDDGQIDVDTVDVDNTMAFHPKNLQ